MNLVHSRSPRSLRLSRSAAPLAASPEIRWIHDGVRYRVTPWPEARFQRETDAGKWSACEMGEPVFASAALGVTSRQWSAYLEFVPAAEREFLEQFHFGRVAALHVIARCPGLLAKLKETPALVAYLAEHVSLCGGDAPRWPEIDAVFERDGLFGLLQWLGLPSSHQTLSILRRIADPDLPRRLLEPLRAALWDPEVIWTLSQSTALTDERLAEACHALAA